MKRCLQLIAVAAALILTGCKDLKDQQVGAYVGDSQTKVYYKNVGQFVGKVPKERRVYFRSVDDAMKEGYVSFQEGGDEPAPAQDSPASDSGE